MFPQICLIILAHFITTQSKKILKRNKYLSNKILNHVPILILENDFCSDVYFFVCNHFPKVK